LGYQTFEDYLGVFNANQRRNIKRERKAVNNARITMRVVAGEEIDPALFRQMYIYYADTCDKFGWWGSKYLTPEFFTQLNPSYRDRVMFVTAYSQDNDLTPMGMSFCIAKGDRLYGRYWGSRQEIDCLHFDACYYTPIEWAISQGINIFDPGAGGRHKKRRGFPARPNYSLHRFYHPRFGQILGEYLREANELEREEIATINAELPMKVIE
jgi:predicted N-acyltransferase